MQEAALTFYTNNGFLDVETSDYSLDGVTWELRLTKESIYSESPQNGRDGPFGIHFITVTFEDPCHTAVLTPAQFADSSLTVYAYDAVSFKFTDFSVNINCLGTSQELIYREGPLLGTGLVLGDFLQITSDPAPSTSKVVGNLNADSWIATHKLVIKG